MILITIDTIIHFSCVLCFPETNERIRFNIALPRIMLLSSATIFHRYVSLYRMKRARNERCRSIRLKVTWTSRSVCKQRGNADLMTKVKGNRVPGENFCFDGAGASLAPRYPCKSISGSSRDISVKAEPSPFPFASTGIIVYAAFRLEFTLTMNSDL